MISVPEARQLLFDQLTPLGKHSCSIRDAVGMVVAEDIIAPINVPSFTNSGVDGYAFCFNDLQPERQLTIAHTIQAGDTSLPRLVSGTAARIFTGAPLPDGADTVVMQEYVQLQNNKVIIEDSSLVRGANVRKEGSQSQKGEKVLVAGTKLSAGAIGFLAGFGWEEVCVFRKPKVGIIVTGKELVKPGQQLLHGQIYESNSFALLAALSQLLIQPNFMLTVDDDEKLINEAVVRGIEQCDLLLVTGGISVGDYDFVGSAFNYAGVEKVFYKVKQKPGKPLYCGKINNKMVFGLPGNPASVLTCFYEYVKPAIFLMMGFADAEMNVRQLNLLDSISKKAGLTHFLKGYYSVDGVRALTSQESYKMNAFVESNCLIELEESRSDFTIGEKVRVLLTD